jgi:hypothetical protein
MKGTREERQKERKRYNEDAINGKSWEGERWIPDFCYTLLIHARFVLP